MANDNNKDNGYREYLQRVRDAEKPLKITSNNWGWVGMLPISLSIIRFWQENELLKSVGENLYRLSEKGERAAQGQMKASEFVTPEDHPKPRSSDTGMVPTSAMTASGEEKAGPTPQHRQGENDLFTESGTCRLCKQVCSLFGWISHAKSRHIAKGDPVEIEDRGKKKVAVITVPIDEAVITVAGSDRPTTPARTSAPPKTTPAKQPVEAKPLAIDVSTMTPEEMIAAALAAGGKGGKR